MRHFSKGSQRCGPFVFLAFASDAAVFIKADLPLLAVLVLIGVAGLAILFVAAVWLAKRALDVTACHAAPYFFANDGAALFAAAELIAAAVVSCSNNGGLLIV